jgi:hypothetical protein
MSDWPGSPLSTLHHEPAATLPIRTEEYLSDGRYTVRFELPGIDPSKDLDVSVESQVLTIHAERHAVAAGKYHSQFPLRPVLQPRDAAGGRPGPAGRWCVAADVLGPGSRHHLDELHAAGRGRPAVVVGLARYWAPRLTGTLTTVLPSPRAGPFRRTAGLVRP